MEFLSSLIALYSPPSSGTSGRFAGVLQKRRRSLWHDTQWKLVTSRHRVKRVIGGFTRPEFWHDRWLQVRGERDIAGSYCSGAQLPCVATLLDFWHAEFSCNYPIL